MRSLSGRRTQPFNRLPEPLGAVAGLAARPAGRHRFSARAQKLNRSRRLRSRGSIPLERYGERCARPRGQSRSHRQLGTLPDLRISPRLASPEAKGIGVLRSFSFGQPGASSARRLDRQRYRCRHYPAVCGSTCTTIPKSSAPARTFRCSAAVYPDHRSRIRTTRRSATGHQAPAAQSAETKGATRVSDSGTPVCVRCISVRVRHASPSP